MRRHQRSSSRSSSRLGFQGAAWMLPLAVTGLSILHVPRENRLAGFIGGVSTSSLPQMLINKQRPRGQRRRCRQLQHVARSAVDKALRDRINTVKKTKKVTETMRLIAAAKVRNAQLAAEQSRPFSEELRSMILGITSKIKDKNLQKSLPMLRSTENVSAVALVVVTSDRGLCGGYNNVVAGRCRDRVVALNKEGIAPLIVPVGRKVAALFRRLDSVGANFTTRQDVISLGTSPNASLAHNLGEELLSLFLAEEVDRIEFVYSKFVNLLKTDPVVRTFLPLQATYAQDPEDELFKLTTSEGRLVAERHEVSKPKARPIEADTLFDQAPEDILNSMLPLYLDSQILAMLREAYASELAARMTAMKAATENAEKALTTLTLEMNKKRQASITQELLEINAAAMASEPTGDAIAAASEEDVTEELLQDMGLHERSPTPLEELRAEAERSGVSVSKLLYEFHRDAPPL
mmetsp:Transcript_70624/g.169229  ORF Transcript_70624/g.169229 Transcript_70624/m.169229 type:complete len:464 (-) Transcript_70624:9-1400(-)